MPQTRNHQRKEPFMSKVAPAKLARRLAAIATLAAVGVLMLAAQGASAAQVPPQNFTCGDPSLPLTPCNQTAHFSDTVQVGTPFASAPSCPAFVTTDFALISGTGSGVEHSIVNNALDGWFTSTFTGTATITAYLDAGLTQPDPNVLPFTGKLTEWFGGSFNKNNFVFHSTFHFDGTAANGTTFRILDVSHTNTTASNPFVPHSFEITSCG
jgi:hypothetical protein